MTKGELIYNLVLALNKGDSYDVNARVNLAIKQYNQIFEAGLICENGLDNTITFLNGK